MTTTMYLIRHGATRANLEQPNRLQGRRCNDALDPIGVRQAEQTRDLLANVQVDRFFSSPLVRAMQTAQIIAEPHGFSVTVIEELTECDVGRWELLSWEAIRLQDPEACQRFERDPGRCGYPGGENFQQVADRVAPTLNRLLDEYAGRTIV